MCLLRLNISEQKTLYINFLLYITLNINKVHSNCHTYKGKLRPLDSKREAMSIYQEQETEKAKIQIVNYREKNL